jgi:hypothetical protein
MHSAVFSQVIVHILVFQVGELLSASITDNSGIIGTLSYSSIEGRLYYVYTSGILTDNCVQVFTRSWYYSSNLDMLIRTIFPKGFYILTLLPKYGIYEQ